MLVAKLIRYNYEQQKRERERGRLFYSSIRNATGSTILLAVHLSIKVVFIAVLCNCIGAPL
jgi:hypothetical protein